MIVDGARRLWTPPGDIIRDGLQLRWTLEDLLDDSGNGNIPILRGSVTLDSGDPSPYFSTNAYNPARASTNYVEASRVSTEMQGILEGTICGWCKIIEIATDPELWAVVMSNGGTVLDFVSLKIYALKSGGDAVSGYVVGNTDLTRGDSLSPIVDYIGTWHHYLITGVNGGSAELYIDGAIQTNTGFTYSGGVKDSSNTAKLGIGRLEARDNISARWNDFRMYNRRLTSVEAAQIAAGTG